MMSKLNAITKRLGKPVWVGLGLGLLAIVAFLDYITGPELSFSVFYLLPVSLIVWAVGGRAGIIAAFVSNVIWMLVDILSIGKPDNWFVYGWNAVIRFSFFVMPVLIIRLTIAMQRERIFARTDYLTGVLNARFFHELAQMEINRSVRYQRPYTIVFLDVDNFKTINDTFGHTTGDTVLRAIATNIKKHLRRTDIVARVGGDEFVVLLTETDESHAPTVLNNIQRELLREMEANGWHVTFSIGAVIVNGVQISVDELLGRADQMMYVVKNNGKNNIHCATLTAEEALAVKVNSQ